MGNEADMVAVMRDLVNQLNVRPTRGLVNNTDFKCFYGHASENFKKWLKFFNRLAQAEGWDDDTKRRTLPFYLRGPADTAYDELTDSDKRDFTTMIDKLNEKLQTPKLDVLAASLLANRKQKDNESVINFANAIQKLIHEAYSDRIDKDARQTLELQYFRNGLKTGLRNLIMIQKPGTMAEAIQAACYFESQDHLSHGTAPWLDKTLSVDAEIDNLDSKTENKNKTSQIYAFQDTKVRIPEPQVRPEDLIRLEKSFSSRIDDMIIPKVESMLSSMKNENRMVADSALNAMALASSRSMPNSTPSRPGKCYACGKPGHMARNCIWRQSSPINSNVQTNFIRSGFNNNRPPVRPQSPQFNQGRTNTYFNGPQNETSPRSFQNTSRFNSSNYNSPTYFNSRGGTPHISNDARFEKQVRFQPHVMGKPSYNTQQQKFWNQTPHTSIQQDTSNSILRNPRINTMSLKPKTRLLEQKLNQSADPSESVLGKLKHTVERLQAQNEALKEKHYSDFIGRIPTEDSSKSIGQNNEGGFSLAETGRRIANRNNSGVAQTSQRKSDFIFALKHPATAEELENKTNLQATGNSEITAKPITTTTASASRLAAISAQPTSTCQETNKAIPSTLRPEKTTTSRPTSSSSLIIEKGMYRNTFHLLPLILTSFCLIMISPKVGASRPPVSEAGLPNVGNFPTWVFPNLGTAITPAGLILSPKDTLYVPVVIHVERPKIRIKEISDEYDIIVSSGESGKEQVNTSHCVEAHALKRAVEYVKKRLHNAYQGVLDTNFYSNLLSGVCQRTDSVCKQSNVNISHKSKPKREKRFLGIAGMLLAGGLGMMGTGFGVANHIHLGKIDGKIEALREGIDGVKRGIIGNSKAIESLVLADEKLYAFTHHSITNLYATIEQIRCSETRMISQLENRFLMHVLTEQIERIIDGIMDAASHSEISTNVISIDKIKHMVDVNPDKTQCNQRPGLWYCPLGVLVASQGSQCLKTMINEPKDIETHCRFSAKGVKMGTETKTTPAGILIRTTEPYITISRDRFTRHKSSGKRISVPKSGVIWLKHQDYTLVIVGEQVIMSTGKLIQDTKVIELPHLINFTHSSLAPPDWADLKLSENYAKQAQKLTVEAAKQAMVAVGSHPVSLVVNIIVYVFSILILGVCVSCGLKYAIIWCKYCRGENKKDKKQKRVKKAQPSEPEMIHLSEMLVNHNKSRANSGYDPRLEPGKVNSSDAQASLVAPQTDLILKPTSEDVIFKYDASGQRLIDAKQHATLQLQNLDIASNQPANSTVTTGAQVHKKPIEYVEIQEDTTQFFKKRNIDKLYSLGNSGEITPIILVKIDNKIIESLVDTGATVTVIDTELYESDFCNHNLDQSKTESVEVASGGKVSVNGTLTLPVNMKGAPVIKHDFKILPLSGYRCVIGSDFLRRIGKVQFDFDNEQLIVNGTCIPFVANKGNMCAGNVFVLETLHVPSRAEVILPCGVYYDKKEQPSTENFDFDLQFIPDLEKLNDLGLQVAPAVFSDGQLSLPVRILNSSRDAVELYENMTVGEIFLLNKTHDKIIPMPANRENVENASLNYNTVHRQSQPHWLTDDVFEGSILSATEKESLKQLLSRHSDIFYETDSKLGRCPIVKHKIDTANHAPIRQKAYRVPMHQRDIIKKHIDDMQSNDVIRPSYSPWASPVVLVKKKNGEDRFCVDYRKLNSVTKKDVYPLPRTDDILDSLGGAKYFSNIDLASGYWQIEMDPADREKTAFTTYSGLYEFNVLPFGLCNAPATFQRLMELVLSGLNYDSCLIYLDDILIFSRTFEEHMERLSRVLTALGNAGLTLRLKKCQFGKSQVEFLGHIISAAGVKPAFDNCEAVKKMAAPQNCDEVRSFIGLMSYYRRFIKDFAKLADPLHQLMKKDAEFKWQKSENDSFELLRNALLTAPILSYPDYKRTFYVHTDASKVGIGAVLSQFDDNERDHPVAYISRTLGKSEKNYATIEWEALAVFWAIKKLRHYLLGSKFYVITDHAPLKWLMTPNHMSQRLTKWSLSLQEYDFEILHRPGKSNANADALSRLPIENLENRQIFAIMQQNLAQNNLEQVNNDHPVAVQQYADEFCRSLIDYIEFAELPQDRIAANKIVKESGVYAISGGMLHRIKYLKAGARENGELQLVVPVGTREEILEAFHDDIWAGHFGIARTFDKIRQRYYWPSMYKDVELWVKGCQTCNARKNLQKRTRMAMQPLPVDGPFDRVAVDYLGPLKETEDGNKYLLVFSDYLTKWPEVYAVRDQKAETVAKIFVEKIVCRHSAPMQLLSDRGANFLSSIVAEICKICDTREVNTTSYHPQTDGLVERFNRTLIDMLSKAVSKQHRHWDRHLPFCLFAYRTSSQDSTKETPFYLLYGREARLPLDTEIRQRLKRVPRKTQKFRETPAPSINELRETSSERGKCGHT